MSYRFEGTIDSIDDTEVCACVTDLTDQSRADEVWLFPKIHFGDDAEKLRVGDLFTVAITDGEISFNLIELPVWTEEDARKAKIETDRLWKFLNQD